MTTKTPAIQTTSPIALDLIIVFTFIACLIIYPTVTRFPQVVPDMGPAKAALSAINTTKFKACLIEESKAGRNDWKSAKC